MSITDLADLSPSARRTAEEFLSTTPADLRDDLRAHLLDSLSPAATDADVRSVIAALGPIGDGTARRGLRGRLLGIPYDFTAPTWDKIISRTWNPADPRIWQPHLFGIGWTPNLGAIAARLGLIEPDAEDDPLTTAPLSPAAILPAAVATMAVLGSAAVLGRSLPDRVGRGWRVDGTPKQVGSRARAIAGSIGWTAGPTAAVAAALAAGAGTTPAQRRNRAGAVVVATAMATGTAVDWLGVVIRARSGRPQPWVGPAAILAAAGSVFGILLTQARRGRRAEQDRDLSGPH
ncbi:DUF5808 domain-containing protein [Granulicoccus phenolivorans]|uniref:DUF5808 domain-containing protein n=1 Tax=Granulicoccus phenolivorans TaxID=266854 RepID=UPI0004182BDE|nr:DUF5808 domain-containing protein [Granulicoccus phenolivorans]